MKFTKKILILTLCGGLFTSVFLVSGQDYNVKASEEIVTIDPLATDKELYKSVSRNIKLPQHVLFKEERKEFSAQYSTAYANITRNKADEYDAIAISESAEGTKYYTHQYNNDDKSQRVTFNAIGTETNIDTTGYNTKTVYLDNGIEAIYVEGDSAQVLAFNELKDNLYYALIGEKEEGKFTVEELLEIANSIE
jgi:hypothetical protein